MERKIAVVWGYFEKNLGDDLMLKAFLDFTKGKYKKIYINSYKEYRRYYETFGVTVVSQNSFFFRAINKIYCLLKQNDLYYRFTRKNVDFIMLGGSLFMEGNTDSNENQINNLSCAIERAGNSYVIGSNFGPYKTEAFLSKYRIIFNKCKDVCFRDKFSYQLFSEIPHVRYAPDIVLSGLWNENPYTKELNPSILISVINLANRQDLKFQQLKYEQLMAEIVVYHERKGDSAVLAAFCEREGDVEACLRIKNLCGDTNVKIEIYKDLTFLQNLPSVKKIYGARFHSVILAMYYGIPCVPLIYSEKTYNALSAYCSTFAAIDIANIDKFTVEEIVSINQKLQIYREVEKEAAEQFEGVKQKNVFGMATKKKT